jgi:hypothetical protein
MEITKMTKEANLINNEVKLTVEITLSIEDLVEYDYEGFDALPDEAIPDIIVAAAKLHKNKQRLLSLLKE